MSAKPKLDNEGLPVGWADRDYDFDTLFDAHKLTALQYDGKQEMPYAWRSEKSGFLASRFDRQGRSTKEKPRVRIIENAVNENMDEDALLMHVADMVWNGKPKSTITVYVMYWMSTQGYDHNCKVSQEAAKEILGLISMGGGINV